MKYDHIVYDMNISCGQCTHMANMLMIALTSERRLGSYNTQSMCYSGDINDVYMYICSITYKFLPGDTCNSVHLFTPFI